MSKLLGEVFLGSHQGLLVEVDRRPPGRHKVLRPPRTPAQHVHQQAAHGRRGAAHPGVTVDVDGVAVLQEPVEQEDGLGEHPDPTYGEEVLLFTRMVDVCPCAEASHSQVTVESYCGTVAFPCWKGSRNTSSELLTTDFNKRNV